MRSKGSRVSAASKLSLLLARRMSQDTPSTSSFWRTISASRGLSSKWSTRSGRVMSGLPLFPQRTGLDTDMFAVAPIHRWHFVDARPEHAHLLHGFDEI